MEAGTARLAHPRSQEALSIPSATWSLCLHRIPLGEGRGGIWSRPCGPWDYACSSEGLCLSWKGTDFPLGCPLLGHLRNRPSVPFLHPLLQGCSHLPCSSFLLFFTPGPFSRPGCSLPVCPTPCRELLPNGSMLVPFRKPGRAGATGGAGVWSLYWAFDSVGVNSP